MATTIVATYECDNCSYQNNDSSGWGYLVSALGIKYDLCPSCISRAIETIEQ